MSVSISSVDKNSPAEKSGIHAGERVAKINGNSIMDVLDYRFYQNDISLIIELEDNDGKKRTVRVEKDEYDELGLNFNTYLMDEKRSCKNKCIFCFIDQLPRGMRKSLYFKDDDSRLSFLFGNYITLTNITEHEIERIIKMHISPVNISVHTTDPELRVRMMSNPSAGKALEIIDRFDSAGIAMNCQLVLCPGINDGEALEKTLAKLTDKPSVRCIAAVPVGITGHRKGLFELTPYNCESAAGVIDIIDRAGDRCVETYGERRVYAADEFYLLCGRTIPDSSFYGDFLQLENGVGLWSLMKNEVLSAVGDIDNVQDSTRKISIATGTAAAPLIKWAVNRCTEINHGLECAVYGIENRYFGGRINVAGLVTAKDISEQLNGQILGDELLIPSVMLRDGNDMFLDSVTLTELSHRLNVKITPVDNDGYELVNRILGIAE